MATIENKHSGEQFVEKGNNANKKKKFQEAAFWFFLENFDTNGEKFNDALKNAGNECHGFSDFLEKYHARGDIDARTKWVKAKELWKHQEKIKEAFNKSLIDFETIQDIKNRMCIIYAVKGKKQTTGTGMIAKLWDRRFIVTNWHVLRDPDCMYVCQFSGEFYLRLNTNFYLNEELDYGLAVFQKNNHKRLIKRGFCDLELQGNMYSSDAIVIFQHPAGRELSISIGTIMEKYPDQIDYTASTERGSSGSFVLGADFKPVALHYGAGETKMINKGHRFDVILADMRENQEAIIKRLFNPDDDEFQAECHVAGTKIQTLREVEAMQKAVCQIFPKDLSYSGSGFLAKYMGTKFILTHDSVIGSDSFKTGEFQVYFGMSSEKPEGKYNVTLNRDPFYLGKLNTTLCFYESKEIEQLYHFDLSELGDGSQNFSGKGDSVIIFQYPQKFSSNPPYCDWNRLHQSIGTIKKLNGKKDIFYDASVAPKGSQGSIVLSAEWKPLAFHHAEVSDHFSNKGIMLSAVRTEIENDCKFFSIHDEIDKHIITALRKKQVSLDNIAMKLNYSKKMIEMFIKTEITDPFACLDESDILLLKMLIGKKRSVDQIAQKLKKSKELVTKFIQSQSAADELDPDNQFLIKSLHKKGRTLKQIAKKLHHSEEVIKAFMDEMKSIEKEKIAGLDHIDHFIIKAMADKNCSPEQIATRLGKVDKKESIEKYTENVS